MGINNIAIPRIAVADEITLTSSANTMSVKYIPALMYVGTGADGAGTGDITVNTQIKNYTNLTIANGETLQFSGFGKYFIYVSGNMVINGAITFPVMAGNAPTTYDAVISTSNAAGAAILPIGRYLYNSLGFPAEAASGCKGATSASTPTNGGGGGGSAGAGGAGGTANGGAGSGYTGAVGGTGKATVFFIVGGSVSFGATATGAGAGGTGAAGVISGLYDGNGGAGGGGGANIYILSGKTITVLAGANIDLSGGIGGAGYSAIVRGGAGGGGGGGGSWHCLCLGAYTNAGTITVTGGAGGAAGGGTGPNGTAGAAGAAGVVEGVSAQK